jgi:hypothetical protein
MTFRGANTVYELPRLRRECLVYSRRRQVSSPKKVKSLPDQLGGVAETFVSIGNLTISDGKGRIELLRLRRLSSTAPRRGVGLPTLWAGF